MQIEELLHSDISCSIALPRLPRRVALEDSKLLKGTRVSVLDEDWDVSLPLLPDHTIVGNGFRAVIVVPLLPPPPLFTLPTVRHLPSTVTFRINTVLWFQPQRDRQAVYFRGQ